MRAYFNNFYGKINGKSINDYKIDNDKYSLETVEERIEYIKELLDIEEIDGIQFPDKFWEEVFEQKNNGTSHINLCPNSDTDLYSTSNICKALEGMGTYILQPDKEFRKKEKLKIYNSEAEFQQALIREKKYIKENGEVNNEEGKPFIVLKPQKNIKLAPRVSYSQKYINEHQEMKDYQDFENHLKEVQVNEEMQNNINKKLNSNKSKGWYKYKCDYMISSIRDDMMHVMASYNPLFIPKKLLKDNGSPNWDYFDPLDKEHMKELLRLYRDKEVYDFQENINCIIFDLQKVLEQVEFTPQQFKVLKMWMNGMEIKEIAKKMKRGRRTVDNILDRAINNIIQIYEEQLEDWYTLNIVKGKYKQCNRCGEIKLESKFNKNGDKGLKSICKKCQ